MHVGAPFDRGDDRNANIRQILENLNTFIVYLAPDFRVGNVAER
jgi:hypothetical protein